MAEISIFRTVLAKKSHFPWSFFVEVFGWLIATPEKRYAPKKPFVAVLPISNHICPGLIFFHILVTHPPPL